MKTLASVVQGQPLRIDELSKDKIDGGSQDGMTEMINSFGLLLRLVVRVCIKCIHLALTLIRQS